MPKALPPSECPAVEWLREYFRKNNQMVRLRAKVSPNIILDEGQYSYLLQREEHNNPLVYGEDSSYYMAQVGAYLRLCSDPTH